MNQPPRRLGFDDLALVLKRLPSYSPRQVTGSPGCQVLWTSAPIIHEATSEGLVNVSHTRSGAA
jgi:hypothetical protein